MKFGFLNTYSSSFFFLSTGPNIVEIGFVSARETGFPKSFLGLVYWKN